MKTLVAAFVLLFLTNPMTAFARGQCDTYKGEIGKIVPVTLATADHKFQNRQFKIVDCLDGVFTATDMTSSSVILQIEISANSNWPVRFIGLSTDSNDFQPVLEGTYNLDSQKITFSSSLKEKCPDGQHWDDSMKMCMPDKCPKGQHWDESMKMCMPGDGPQDLTTMFHYNQFIVWTNESGPRGRSALSAPNMWMLMFDKKTSDNNSVGVNWMGTVDLWTVPHAGTPQLLQTGEANSQGVPYVDAQHPHSSPVMGLTFYDILSFGANGEKKLTFFFAPRGEATAGPQAFMHRETGVINPDAPLSHHLQDVFHLTSTVVGMKLDVGRLSLEGSTFSGVEPDPSRVTLDTHKPDSYALRANYALTENISTGASFAKVRALDRVNNPQMLTEDERFYSAWVSTSHKLGDGQFSTTTIWGQNDNKSTAIRLNSFLEEFLYSLNKNDFYGRLEVLQRTPDQLEIQLTDGSTGAKWVKAMTLGYERQIEQRDNLKVYIGAAATQNFVPVVFQPYYGANPISEKIYLRVNFGQAHSH